MTYEVFIKENISSYCPDRVDALSSRIIHVQETNSNTVLNKSKAELYLRAFMNRAEAGLKEKFAGKSVERFTLIDNVLEQRVAVKISEALDNKDLVVTFSSVVYEKKGTSSAVIVKNRHTDQLIFFGVVPLDVQSDVFISACMNLMEIELSKELYDLHKSSAFFALKIAQSEKLGVLSPYYRSDTVAQIINL